MNNSNSGKTLTSLQRVITITGIVLSFLVAIPALADGGYISAVAFSFLGITLLSRLSPSIAARLPFLNVKRIRIGMFVGLTLIGLIALAQTRGSGIRSDIAKPTVEATKEEQPNATVGHKNDGQVYYDVDGNKISKSTNVTTVKNIPGIQPVDIYGNFEKKGFQVEKQVTSEGATFICTSEEDGIDYEVKAYCEEGVSDVISIRLTATRINPQDNSLSDLKPFMYYGCSIPYDGSDPLQVRQFINKNWNNDKASTLISGVKFTIYCPTQFARMIEIEKG